MGVERTRRLLFNEMIVSISHFTHLVSDRSKGGGSTNEGKAESSGLHSDGLYLQYGKNMENAWNCYHQALKTLPAGGTLEDNYLESLRNAAKAEKAQKPVPIQLKLRWTLANGSSGSNTYQ